MGRPSTFGDEIFDQICELMGNGQTLVQICRDEAMPDRSTVLRWIANDDGKRRKYDAARRACVEYWSDQIIEIATDGSKDTKIDRRGRRSCDWEWLGRSKLRVETMFKLMGKINPERYGDKLPEAIHARQIEAAEQQSLARPITKIEHVIVEPGGRDDDLRQRIAELEAALANKTPGIGHNNPPSLIEHDPGPLPRRMDATIAQRIVRLVKAYVRLDDQRPPEAVLDEVLTVCRNALRIHFHTTGELGAAAE
jgi:hypothetical protein